MEETVERPDRFRKVKDLVQNVKTNATVKTVQSHVTENKATYIVGAIGVLAYISKSRPIQITVSPVIAPIMNNVVNNTVNNTGFLHKIVKDLDTGEMWEQIGHLATEIAEKHQITYESARTLLSKHLNGHSPSVYGKIYRIAGVGTTGS